MWAQKFTIDGFEFILQGTHGEDGVVIPPDADLSDPKYLIGLQKALDIYRYVNIGMCIGEYASAYGIDRAGYLTFVDQPIDDKTLDEIIAMGDELIAQNHITISDELKSYLEVAKQNKAYRQEKERLKKEKQAAKMKPKPGYVYLIQSPTGTYKIGRTKNPDDRMKTFAVKLPFEVDYVCIITCENMYAVESQLHMKFDSKRVNGEWFVLSPEDVEYIKGLVK